MGYSIDPISEGCYPGTTVLVNRFDIQDEEKLNEVEAVITATRSAQWLNAPFSSDFDFQHYCAIHRFLFHDLYDWAGTVRSVDISKKGTHFMPARQIDTQADLIFSRLKMLNYFRSFTHDRFVEEIADFYCATNYLHPFREGNGRTQRVFLSQLISSAGYRISFADMDTDLLMIATIQAAQGVRDLLIDIFRHAIQ